jgi:hypothetical protein
MQTKRRSKTRLSAALYVCHLLSNKLFSAQYYQGTRQVLSSSFDGRLPEASVHGSIPLQSGAQPQCLETLVSRTVMNSGAKPTAASSTGIAPFAMLCLPGRGLLENGRITFVPFCCSRSLRHSSSVATYPSSSAKNLCRSTVLIRSRARLLNHPSRS